MEPENNYVAGSAVKLLDHIDVAVLAGGFGTRIRGVLGDTPKVLAPINGRPYLDHLMAWLKGYGVEHIVLCLGHQAQKVQKHLGQDHSIECIVEKRPLGTGGAIQNCRHRLRSDLVLIMNGDTWLETDLAEFVAAHNDREQEISMICVPVDDVSRYGKISIDGNTITSFSEKDIDNRGAGYINGGIYLFSQAALDRLCDAPVISLEKDFFHVLPAGTIHAYIPTNANFIDIGTPETLADAGNVLPRYKSD